LQLKALFGDEWENYAAQAGIILTLGGPNDLFTANWMSERCGVTTILQASYSASDGVNNSDNMNAGSGFNPGGMSTNQGQGSGFGRNAGGSLNFTQTERRVMLAQELMELPNGHGRIFVPGWGSLSIPFFAPNYWMRREAWVARVRENPYYARKVRR
jgi:type IV secretory pathway TraG/TraD family ATPase VirD4